MLEEQLAKTIRSINTWDQIEAFKANVRAKNRWSPEIEAALKVRAAELGRALVAERTGLDLDHLSPAEERIVQAVSEYASIKKQQGSQAGRTMQQLKNHGLLGAAAIAVQRKTGGYTTLVEEDKADLSYEQIILDYPHEFPPRALWHARRNLGLPTEGTSPPADALGDTQTRTLQLVKWLKERAKTNAGLIQPFTNTEAATAIGWSDLRIYGRAYGNIQSRLDFACYLCGLPPLGLAATSPFAKAWPQEDRDWAFPKDSMQAAAQSRGWASEDFDRIAAASADLPWQAHGIWKDAMDTEETKVKAWATSLSATENAVPAEEPESQARNPPWGRDELILALHLYLAHRPSLPGKESPEVQELSEFLNAMGRALGVLTADTFRNTNGVYMKLMNFRRFDPTYISGGKVGLTRGNKDEEVVWSDFAGDPARLALVSAAIRAAVSDPQQCTSLADTDEVGIVEAEEGRVLTRIHRSRERSRKLVEAKKTAVLKTKGKLACEACDFDFGKTYGPSAQNIIDCHHTRRNRPVSTV